MATNKTNVGGEPVSSADVTVGSPAEETPGAIPEQSPESSADAITKENTDTNANTKEHPNGLQRKPRKVAICFGFEGSKYRGLQISYLAGIPTIEGELRKALGKSHAFREETENVKLEKLGWSRSSRTDAGVHARVLVCGGKFNVPEDNLDVFRDELNANLPAEIRVFSISKVPKSFDAKKAASWREYSYIVPKFEKIGALDTIKLQAALDVFTGVNSYHNFCNLKRHNFNQGENQGHKFDDGDDEENGKGEGKSGKGDGKSGKGSKKDKHNKRQKKGKGKKGKSVDGEEKLKENETDQSGEQSQEVAEQSPVNGSETSPKRRKIDPEAAKIDGKIDDLRVEIENSKSVVKKPDEVKTVEEGLQRFAPIPGHMVDSDGRMTKEMSQFLSNLTVTTMVDWTDIFMRGIDPEVDNLPPRFRFRHRAAQVMQHAASSIYYFRIVEEEEDFIEIRVRGQFFLYNQIRLMVGAALAVGYGHIDLNLVKQAMVSKIECQFPLAPAEGLCLFTAGFSGLDTRSGKMALDPDQYRRCFTDEYLEDSSININSNGTIVESSEYYTETGKNVPQHIADAERSFVLMDEQSLNLCDGFYKAKIRPYILSASKKIYEHWYLESGIQRVKVSNEALEAIKADIEAEEALEKKHMEANKPRIESSRKFAFDEFYFQERCSEYNSVYPKQFTTELLVSFPEEFLPGRKLTAFQVGLLKSLGEQWANQEGDAEKSIAPWKLSSKEIVSYVKMENDKMTQQENDKMENDRKKTIRNAIFRKLVRKGCGKDDYLQKSETLAFCD